MAIAHSIVERTRASRSATGDTYTAQIAAQMEAAGIEQPPSRIIADGKVHRFASTSGKGASAWYVVHPDPVAPVWFFGDWRTGSKERGEGDPGRVLDPAEDKARRARLTELQRKIRAEEARFQAGAAIEARQRWDRAKLAPADHEYLHRKGVGANGTRVDGGALLIPMRDGSGKLWSLQEIWPDGRKHNQEGGRRKGCWFMIGEPGDTLCIGEGFATCATLHEATGYAVASAGEAGNLEAVAIALRAKYPATQIIVCGDDDWMTRVNGKPRNVGKIAAEKAAKAVGGVVALPWFHPSGRPRWAKDFNDMAKLHGLDEVATRIRLDRIDHEEAAERERQSEPPPATGPEDYGLPTGQDSATFSEDALALQFATEHTNDLRFVAAWSRWSEWIDGRWVTDEKLHVFSLARIACRSSAGGVNE